MGEANENRNRSREMLNLSLRIEKYPRDLLQRFMSSTSDSQQLQESEEINAEEIELNLGLSLGGRFGVDKNAKKKLLRSGSIPIFREFDLATTTARTNATSTTQAVTYPSIIRASSLPTETEEEWRKRKEMQTLRRLEAKRRRNEKQKNLSSIANNISKFDKMDVNMEEEKQNLAGNKMVGPPFGMQSWVASARQGLLGGGVKGGGGEGGGGGFMQGLVQPCSQGSLESQGWSSSGMSEFESKSPQGTSSGGEARNSVTTQSLQDQSYHEAVGSSGTNVNENVRQPSRAEMENLSKKLERRNSSGSEIVMNAYEDMPCVFTKGNGPNGRKIEGILYRYGKGEEVRIMCVCHGSFLSPAEFVKHAGGGDVDHPLRHIVVNPSTAPFL